MKQLLLEAKQRLSITELWSRRGWTGKPDKSCRFPNDEEGKPCCSIFVASTGRSAGLQLLKNHKTGFTYDAPGLLSEVEGLTIKEACRIYISLAGVKPLDDSDTARRSNKKNQSSSVTPVHKETPKPVFDFRLLNPRELDADEVEAIATSRDVSARTIEALMKFGVIHSVTISHDVRVPIPNEKRPLQAWALHSHDWQSFRLRPFGRVFPKFQDKTYKAFTPSGGSCSQPVWIGDESAERILVVEGEGDGVAAVEIMRREQSSDGLAIVVIFSSSVRIPPSYLSRFEGRKVRIIPHVGDGKRQGEIAAVKWSASLRPWAAQIEIFNLNGLQTADGDPVGDVGDLCKCSPETLLLLGVTKW